MLKTLKSLLILDSSGENGTQVRRLVRVLDMFANYGYSQGRVAGMRARSSDLPFSFEAGASFPEGKPAVEPRIIVLME